MKHNKSLPYTTGITEGGTSVHVAKGKQNQPNHESDYEKLGCVMRGRLASVLAAHGPNVFFAKGIDSGDNLGGALFDKFLDNLPDALRQYYNCRACRSFISNYGRLVVILPDGTLEPAILPTAAETPRTFRESIGVMRFHLVHHSTKAGGVFYGPDPEPGEPSAEVWGRPETNGWNHLFCDVPESFRHADVDKTPSQKSAEKREDLKMLLDGLHAFSMDNFEAALNVLQDDRARTELCENLTKWLISMKRLLQSRDIAQTQKINLIWVAVAEAPAGWCHVKSGLIGSLLDDVKNGFTYQDALKRFKAKTGGDDYQRPKAAPTEGNINQGNELIRKMGAEPSLARRYARLEEIQTFWKPRQYQPERKSVGGVFDILKESARPVMMQTGMPADKRTWVRFRDEVLPDALKIEFYVTADPMNYGSFSTAVYPDAPPILVWDQPNQRNPFSVFLYQRRTFGHEWGLSSYNWVDVPALAYRPVMWADENAYPNQVRGFMLILNGARDKQDGKAGLALFPSILKKEFHSVRATIEAYSNKTQMQCAAEGSACGLLLSPSGGDWHNVRIRVTNQNSIREYILDRWS